MATRSAAARLGVTRSTAVAMSAARGGGLPRYFSDTKGRVLSEEERAAENVYIQKMEREKMEKMKKKAEKEKAEQEKQGTDKKSGESDKS